MSSSSNMLADYIRSSRYNYIYPQGTLPSNLFFRKTEKNPYWLGNLRSQIIYCEKKDIKLENTKVESTTNKNIKKYILTDLDREFYLSTPTCITSKLPIILLFHGGGEDPWNDKGTGIMNYTKFYKTNSICIACRGQKSNNGHTYNNAFPWLKNNPENDIHFVETVIERLKKSTFSKNCDFNRIYASGKSDGGGFCFYLLEYSNIKIKKVSTCSSAHFTLDSKINTKYLSNNIQSVPILAIHGTGDIVMPYNGQQFLNEEAVKRAEYWKTIDPTLNNTYTFDVPFFWDYIGKLFNKKDSITTDLSNNLTLTNWGSVKLMTAKHQNHCWMGHKRSGPESDKSSNKYFDATSLICYFFDNIKLINYQNDIKTPKTMFLSIS